MPEGDTIYRAAQRVRTAIEGRTIVSVDGSDPGLRAASGQFLGSQVVTVKSYGKHLLIYTDAGLGIRTHLGMPGRWRVFRAGQPWHEPPGAARVVIRVEGAEAVCFSAPGVEVDRVTGLEARLAEWGPDLADPGFDLAEACRRVSSLAPDRTAADLVLDQRVAAGAGNVYKSEVLFLERVHPDRLVADLQPATLRRILSRSHQLLRLNLDRAVRVTTADSRRGHHLWVYGRAGRPCRRCGTAIQTDRRGDHDRQTFWCPACQPVKIPANGADRS